MKPLVGPRQRLITLGLITEQLSGAPGDPFIAKKRKVRN